MLIFYLSYFVILSLMICFLCLVKGKKIKVRFSLNKLAKILAVIYVVLSFIDVFMPDAFSLRYIWDFNYLKENHDSLHAVVRALNAVGVISVPIAVFFENKSFKKVMAYFMLPVSIINIAFYYKYIGYFTSELTYEYATVFGETLWPYLTNFTFRSILFGVINLLQTVLAFYSTLWHKSQLKFESKKQVGTFIALIIALLFSNMPIYTIQQLFGEITDITFNFGDPTHIAFIFFVIIEGFVLTLIFRRQSYTNRYILLLVMALSLLFQYNTFFKTDGIITATRYPLQLCNIAGLFVIITLIKRSNKMFHFTVVVNTVGALIAIILCDSTKDIGILYCMNIHYMVEHINVLLIPILGLTLHVFKPLKLSDIRHFVVGFTVYFLSIWCLGTAFNSIARATKNGYFTCNYLFMFSKDSATRLVGSWVGQLFDIKIKFNYIEVYFAQICVYFVFMLICVLAFLALWAIFKEKGRKDAEK